MNDALAVLRDPVTIRLRCQAITQAVADERSGWFRLNRGALPALADRVAALMRQRFPDLDIPLPGCWRHFESGGVDRKAELEALLAGRSATDRARAMIDLAVVSALLGASAGAAWRFKEGERDFQGSEGLGVAAFRAFMAGAFSSDAAEPWRVDAAALTRLDSGQLRSLFQVTVTNPLVGLEGRAGLLNRLGEALQVQSLKDGTPARPALLYDRLTAGGCSQLSATRLLGEVLRAFALAWNSGSMVSGVPAGDVWPHRFAGGDCAAGFDSTTTGWVPFHQLSQWLACSLLEPLQWAGVVVTGLDALTGLPGHRNGGLFVDGGVIVPRYARDAAQRWKPGEEFVVEWRALTVTLLDDLAVLVRERLGRGAEQLPLAGILEGGTWAAGRQIAAERRDGSPPFQVDSDGTLF